MLVHLNKDEASTAWPVFHLSDKCLWQQSCPFDVSLAINVSREANLKITNSASEELCLLHPGLLLFISILLRFCALGFSSPLEDTE